MRGEYLELDWQNTVLVCPLTDYTLHTPNQDIPIQIADLEIRGKTFF